MPKKKGFIDRKRAVKFSLVQQPVQTKDTVVNNQVLMPITDTRARKKMNMSEEEIARLEAELSGSVLKDVPKSIWEEYDEEDEYEEEYFDDIDAQVMDMDALHREMGYEGEHAREHTDGDGNGDVAACENVDDGDNHATQRVTSQRIKKQHQIYTTEYGGEEGEVLSQEHIDKILSRYGKRPAVTEHAIQELQKRVSNQFNDNDDSGVVVVNNDDAFDPDWDPEVRTALDNFDDGEYEEFDDDFLLTLMGDGPEEGEPEQTDSNIATVDSISTSASATVSNSEANDTDNLDKKSQSKSKSNYKKAYSTTSAYKKPIVDRELDNEFDEFLDEYEDENIGDLEDRAMQRESSIRGDQYLKDIDGLIDEFLQKGAPQFKKKHYYEELDLDNFDDDEKRPLDGEQLELFEAKLRDMGMTVVNPMNRKSKKEVTRKEVVELIKQQLRQQAEREENGKDEDKYDTIEVKEREQWDCESIISTYSNLDNHPTLIKESKQQRSRKDNSGQIKLSSKTGMPLGVLDHNINAKTAHEDEAVDIGYDSFDSDDDEPINLGEPRNKKETKEEKRERKQAMKELKRLRREDKKKLKGAFKKEENRQNAIEALPHTKQKVVIKYT